MKRAGIALAILIACGLSAALTAYFYSSQLRVRDSAEAKVKGSQQEALAKLEAAQAGFKAVLAQNQRLQDALEKQLDAEKRRFAGLQEKVWELMSQNKALIKKVVLYRVEERREKELEQKLHENIRKNEELGDQLLALKRRIEDDLAVSTIPAVPANARVESSDNLERKLSWLATKDGLNQAELEKREQKIQTLQDSLRKMEEKLSLAFEQFKEMERESALLRERNIALQLERESLIGDLAAARSDLGEMQEKLSQIGGLLLSRAKEAGGDPEERRAEEQPAKKVEVELRGGKQAESGR